MAFSLGSLIRTRTKSGGSTARSSNSAQPFALSTRPLVVQQGSIAYQAGRTGNPLPLLKSGLAARAVVNVNGSWQFNQPADAAAPTFTGGGPWNLAKSVSTIIGGGGYVNRASGLSLYTRELFAHPAFTDNSSYPLPPAAGAGGATPVEDWNLNLELPWVMSEDDLTGLLLLQSQNQQVNVEVTWAQASDIMNLPNGTTATFTGTASVDTELFALPANQASWPNLSVLHTVEDYQYALSSTKQLINPPVGDVYTRIFVMPWTNGAPDTTNALGLTEITLEYGQYRQFTLSTNTQGFLNRLRDRGNEGGGVYVIDLTKDAPRDYLDTSNMSQMNLWLYFDAAPPAGSYAVILLERLHQLQAA